MDRVLMKYEGRQVTYTTLVGSTVRRRRAMCGLTQGTIAEALRRDRAGYSRLERGVEGIWNVSNLLVVGRGFGLLPSRFLDEASALEQEITPYVEVVPADRLDWSREPLRLEELQALRLTLERTDQRAAMHQQANGARWS